MTDPSHTDKAPEDVMLAVQEADERLAAFVAALYSAASYDARRELWLQAIEDSQLEADLRTLFGTLK